MPFSPVTSSRVGLPQGMGVEAQAWLSAIPTLLGTLLGDTLGGGLVLMDRLSESELTFTQKSCTSGDLYPH